MTQERENPGMGRGPGGSQAGGGGRGPITEDERQIINAKRAERNLPPLSTDDEPDEEDLESLEDGQDPADAETESDAEGEEEEETEKAAE